MSRPIDRRDEDRAITPTVTHAMAIGITTILVAGLLVGAGQIMADRQELVSQKGLENVGAAVTTDLLRLDQFEPTGNVSFATRHPSRVAGQHYAITLDPTSERTVIRLRTTGQEEVRVPIRYDNETAVCPSRVTGGRIVVAFDARADCLELRDGS